MRIEFANAARDGLAWTGPLLRIGQAADNDLVLDDAGVAAHHLSLRRMPGTLVLEVEPGAGRVYVNARPVHERALLRAGDSLGVGKCRLRLCADAAVPDDDGEGARGEPLTVALRAVAGPLSGRVMPLDERLELGPRGHVPLDLPHGDEAALAVVRRDGGLYLDAARVPAELALFVNGRATRDTPLHDGDQIALGAHRFVVDAWVPARTTAHAARDVFLPHEADLPEDTAGPRGEVWWLIVTAAVLGLAIALLLFVRF
jgi:pSer/pThr/pTyr-binding forkhead associated (FHA) protein